MAAVLCLRCVVVSVVVLVSVMTSGMVTFGLNIFGLPYTSVDRNST